jgi:anti-anti-sigma regulatory factor
MIDVAGGWALDVQRGPGWLFVRLNSAPEGWWQAPPLAECIWSLLQQHFVYRVVLECDEIPRFTSEMVEQLVLLRNRIDERGGVIRLCGLSPANQDALVRCRLIERFPAYADREEAVMASRPTQPR